VEGPWQPRSPISINGTKLTNKMPSTFPGAPDGSKKQKSLAAQLNRAQPHQRRLRLRLFSEEGRVLSRARSYSEGVLAR
jgi:hypothetical protein